MTATEQLAFDFDFDAPEPLYYDHFPDPKKDLCRDCRRPVKGFYAHMAGGGGGGQYWMECDRCIDAAARRNFEKAPFYDCGRHKQRYEADAHFTECLQLVCPFCGEQERNSYLLGINHSPDWMGAENEGRCYKQHSRVLRGDPRGDELVHGIVSVAPPTIRCDGCELEVVGEKLALTVLTCGIVFNPRLPDDDRRLCVKCRTAAGWDIS